MITDEKMKNTVFTKNELLTAIGVSIFLIALTIVGSFYDYEISCALYVGQHPEENAFGVIFAFIGIMPTFVGWSFLGASILSLSRQFVNGKARRRWLTAFAVLLFVLSFFYFCNTLMMVNANAFSVHWAIAYPIGIVTLALAALLGYRASRRCDDPSLIKKVLLLSAVSVAVMILIMSTKGIMERPRFRFVLETSVKDYFVNWWRRGHEISASLPGGIVSDELASFPSGHSAYSMFALLLFPAFADYSARLKRYRSLLAVSGFAWWCLTALSRITVGAHYLTDVSIAALTVIAVWMIARLIVYAAAKRKGARS